MIFFHTRTAVQQPVSLPIGVLQRSKVDVFSGVCLFVNVFICPHDNFRTIKRRMMKLGD